MLTKKQWITITLILCSSALMLFAAFQLSPGFGWLLLLTYGFVVTVTATSCLFDDPYDPAHFGKKQPQDTQPKTSRRSTGN
jgi:hypothetical protein